MNIWNYFKKVRYIFLWSSQTWHIGTESTWFISLHIAFQFMVTCIKCLFFSSKQTIHSQLSPRDIGVKLSHLSKKTDLYILYLYILVCGLISWTVVFSGKTGFASVVEWWHTVIPFKIVMCKFYFWSYCGILILIPLKVDPL